MAFPVNYSVYHSGLPATPMKPTKKSTTFIPSAIATITEFSFDKENSQPANSNVQPPSTPPRSLSPQTPTKPAVAAPSTPPRSPSPNQPAVAKTPSSNKRYSSPNTNPESPSKRLKTPLLSAASDEAEASLLSSLLPDFNAFSEETSTKACTPAAPSVSAEDKRLFANRTKMLNSGKYPNAETALGLLGKNTFAGHQKREFLGAGNFCETFATENPNFVVKHLHHDGTMLRMFFTVATYWAKIQANYTQLEKLKVPVAKIENIATLDTDLFAVQQRVKPMKELDPQHLVPGNQFAEQLKTAIAECYNNGLLIEIKQENIGFIETAAGPQLQLIDIDDQTEEDGLEINLDRTLKSFGKELGAYLDPRNK